MNVKTAARKVLKGIDKLAHKLACEKVGIGTTELSAGFDREMPFCKACQSYHVEPRTKAEHDTLKCFATWKGEA